MRGEPGLDFHLVGIVDEAYSELNDLEQPPQMLFGCVGEVEGEEGSPA